MDICVDRSLIKYRQHTNQQLGAPIQTIAGHIASAQERSNYENYRQMPVQYQLLYDRLEGTKGGVLQQRRKMLLQEKIKHMVCRAELSKCRLKRVLAIATGVILDRYRKYGYGWRDVIRDLLVNLEA
jgi:hypothetical protein